MKNAFYDVTVCFCESGIIANTCTCKVGCYGIERVICIHILPVIQQLSVQIYVSLATEFLCKLNYEWGIEMHEDLVPEQINKLQRDILCLIQASNRHEPKEYNESMLVEELLKKYDAGTDK